MGINKWEFSNGHSTGWLFSSTVSSQIGINGVLVFVEGEKTEDLEKKLWSIDIRTNNKLYFYLTPGPGGKCSQHCTMPSPLHIGEYIYIIIYMFLPQQSVQQGIKKGPTCSNHDYAFRCYVISHLPSLLVLDDHAIDADEREEARKVYGNRRVSVSSKKVSKKHKEKVSNLAISPCLQMTVFPLFTRK